MPCSPPAPAPVPYLTTTRAQLSELAFPARSVAPTHCRYFPLPSGGAFQVRATSTGPEAETNFFRSVARTRPCRFTCATTRNSPESSDTLETSRMRVPARPEPGIDLTKVPRAPHEVLLKRAGRVCRVGLLDERRRARDLG